LRHLDKLRPLTLFLLRAALGIVFVFHGWPRLSGRAAEVPQFLAEPASAASLAYLFAVLAVFGGVLLIVGLFTRAMALLLAAHMGWVFWRIASLHGYLAVDRYEIPLILCVACLALASFGGGFLSADRPLFGDRSRAPRAAKNKN
jgi:putative oxidoreductase